MEKIFCHFTFELQTHENPVYLVSKIFVGKKWRFFLQITKTFTYENFLPFLNVVEKFQVFISQFRCYIHVFQVFLRTCWKFLVFSRRIYQLTKLFTEKFSPMIYLCMKFWKLWIELCQKIGQYRKPGRFLYCFIFRHDPILIITSLAQFSLTLP